MGRNKDLSTEDIRMDALVKSEYEKQIAAEKYIEEAEEIIRHAEENVEDFPDDEEDQRRRFLEIMKEMRAQGQLTEEEEAQLFGDEADKEDENIERGTEEISATSSEVAEEAASGNTKTRKSRNAGKKISAQKAVEMSIWKRIGRTVGKWAAVVAVTCMGMFALTMSSQANRQYIFDSVRYVMGRDTRVNVNSDDGALIRGMAEDEARIDIEEQMKVEVPIMRYRPKELVFLGYELYLERGCTIFHYQLGENKIILFISNNENKGTRSVLYDGKSKENIELLEGKIDASIYESADKDDGPSYGAEWEFKNVYYRLTGKLEKEEFEKIIKKICY